MEPRNRFRGIDFASLCSLSGRYNKQGCRTGTPVWESILRLHKRSTNTSSGICSRVKGWKIDSWNRFGIEVPMSMSTSKSIFHTESILGIDAQVFINVYKYGLWRAGSITRLSYRPAGNRFLGSFNCYKFGLRARICRSCKETRYRFSAWRAGRKPYLSYWPARPHRLAKSIPQNRFLGSINVYKYGLGFLPSKGVFFSKLFVNV